MSLKEDINYIKKEISTEESFMESFFKLEKFYKKYKVTLIVAVVVIVLGTIGYYTSSYMSQQNKIESNKAFNTLLNKPNDKEAIAVLKENNPKLLQIASFMKDNTKKNELEFLKELSSYSLAIKANSTDEISKVSQNQNFLIKDFALFNKALIQTKNQNYKEAKESLKQISDTSEVNALSKMLEHFLLTK